ncbi:hypothetical protein AB6A40_003826 [Gnathostoma spinigerum]|uniref:Reverse transcriptase domain-containing protein n=1 Tax=Gnathostoma spinigerum TaxID=75299 RepID=A0ABD6EK93_9BILA
MPFGIASAPAIFQRVMDQLLAGIPHCAAYLDDIIVTGANEEEHLETLRRVLRRVADYGFKCKREKCAFMQNDVTYLGHIIDRTGKRPNPERVAAIKNLPRPRNVTEVEAFLGKVNYYGRFIAELSDKCEPLNRLRRKGAKFKWSQDCQRAFERLKNELAGATVLVHYDPKLPLVLATDASSYGVGAVLMHRYADGSEKPIAHASKTLTAAEKNYGQIDKEGLAIIYGVKKFHQYLAGRQFELVTDHKPLVAIFNPAKGIPQTMENRLQRWALCLSGYRYTIRYKPTTQHSNADALSRLPSGPDATFEDVGAEQIRKIQAVALQEAPVKQADILAETRKWKLMQTVHKFVTSQWPRRMNKVNNPELNAYFKQ